MSLKIQLVRIAHVFYTHKDIDKARMFLEDFGMHETKRVGDDFYYCGTGSEPFVYCARKGQEDAFGGAAFVVESETDLEAAQALPVDKFPFHLVHSQTALKDVKTLPLLDFNFPEEKHRLGNKTQRFQKGPAPVHKLGHFGMCVTDFTLAYDFYTTHFNFKASNLVYDGSGRDITTFLHLDRGFWVMTGSATKAMRIAGGVGRHIMGSQIFDYWFDTSRFILEHYVDGDLINDTSPTERELASPSNLHVWGPDLPP
ncbi:hypothetical protein N7481_005039 [Penicillium waksmanii]|uniref:uncharacterized protein n=1 Tax=Penicillium waksmanii TaxID=69791 RepID=UPI00254940C9|nr:uncharacterized protein N7481_005039 [Penicillium waksmanii]KAJ5982940.1 hypothetical protein N7481_005039 [Penicillium waksmanii]